MAPHGLSIDVADLMTTLSAPEAAASDHGVSVRRSAGMPDDPSAVEHGCVRIADDQDEDDELDDDELEDEEDEEDEEEEDDGEEEGDDEEEDDGGGWEDEDEEEYDDEDEDEEDEDEPMQASR